VRRLVPDPREERLDDVYGDLVLPTRSGRAWIALGMVASVDGAASVGGVTEDLGGPADRRAFRALRSACDAILVGAGTVRDEDYGPGAGTVERRRDREAKGLAPTPRLVIVSGSLALDPTARVFSDPGNRPLVVTSAAAPRERAARLGQVAEVLSVGRERVDLAALAMTLPQRGLHRVLCEGGPTLNASLVAEDLVDELFLTIDPVLVGGEASRIVAGSGATGRRPLQLVELREHEGELLLRYQLAPAGGNVAPVSG
jgi:riboflavin-specific deaminase-like protein